MKALVLILTLALGCGSSVEVDPSTFAGDAATDLASDARAPDFEASDMGTGLDTDVPDMIVEVDMGPVVQPSYKVLDAMQETCSTGSVKGLSLQLIDQMNCLDPGVMKSFAGANNLDYSPIVFPFQQGPATDTLIDVVADGPTMSITSALRTLPQQYLLYQWYQLRNGARAECNANLAASPGRSNHNGGLAVDISDSDTWRSRMRAADYIDNVGSEPWHFFYSGDDGKDVRNLSVLAFQQLWNLNYPNETIDEDGLYGPQTEGALERAPADGFAIAPMCQQIMSFVAWPGEVPVEVAEREDGAVILVPGGIEYVEIRADGEVFEGLRRSDGLRFDHEALDGDYQVIAYDGDGRVRGASKGFREGEFHVRPLGNGNYAVTSEASVPGAKVEIELDGTRLFTAGDEQIIEFGHQRLEF